MTTPLPDTYLSEIEARLNAATPGEWSTEYFTGPNVLITAKVDEMPYYVWNTGAEPRKEDLCFIAHAPADIAALLAEVNRLKYDLKLRDMLAESDRNIMEAMISTMRQHGIDCVSIVQEVQQKMKGAAE